MKLVEVEENRWIFEDLAITDGAWEKLDQALESLEADYIGHAENMLLAIVAEYPSHIDALHHLSIIYDEGIDKLTKKTKYFLNLHTLLKNK